MTENCTECIHEKVCGFTENFKKLKEDTTKLIMNMQRDKQNLFSITTTCNNFQSINFVNPFGHLKPGEKQIEFTCNRDKND